MGLKPHIYRELVNDLTDIARTYADTQCLRDVISRRLGQDVKIESINNPITERELIDDLRYYPTDC